MGSPSVRSSASSGKADGSIRLLWGGSAQPTVDHVVFRMNESRTSVSTEQMLASCVADCEPRADPPAPRADRPASRPARQSASSSSSRRLGRARVPTRRVPAGSPRQTRSVGRVGFYTVERRRPLMPHSRRSPAAPWTSQKDRQPSFPICPAGDDLRPKPSRAAPAFSTRKRREEHPIGHSGIPKEAVDPV
jgi:hypothetical protein